LELAKIPKDRSGKTNSDKSIHEKRIHTDTHTHIYMYIYMYSNFPSLVLHPLCSTKHSPFTHMSFFAFACTLALFFSALFLLTLLLFVFHDLNFGLLCFGSLS
jgi:hypothetical protein